MQKQQGLMSKQHGVRGGFLNVALLVLGLGVLVLGYALVTGSLLFRSLPSTEAPTARDVSPVRENNPGHLVSDIIQVAVRNGTGAPGIAAQTTRYLREQGFDVVVTGNYRSFDQEETIVIDRVGNPMAAGKVARVLGLPSERVHEAVSPTYYLDATVVLGADYKELKLFAEAEKQRPPREGEQ